jgi:hypothetical protein
MNAQTLGGLNKLFIAICAIATAAFIVLLLIVLLR